MTLPPAYNPKVGTAAAASAPLNSTPTKASALPPLASSAAQPSATETALKAAVPVTAEGVMQRLRYFENLAEQHENYIEQLKAALTRLGGAVPVAYFAPLNGAGGTHSPKSG